MVILGLTGSIGMGKSTAAAMLTRLGVPVHDADAAVHRLVARGGAAVPAIARAFPGTVAGGAVDRRKLGAAVFADPRALNRLEAILHPLVRREESRFLSAAARRRVQLVALNIPLLFETRGERRCDAVAVVTAPPAVQRARVMRRAGMTREKLAGVLSRQTPDALKRRRADHVVLTGLTKRATLVQLARVVRALKTARGRRWRPGAAG
ncbi:MAG: dephospho-CoA kinase [Rhodospirillales bacterium]